VQAGLPRAVEPEPLPKDRSQARWQPLDSRPEPLYFEHI
jgi:hypothetical protein